MADEATVRCSLQIVKDDLQYNSLPATFQADVTGRKGPTPGAITVSRLGTSVTFSELSTPGFLWMQNLDSTYSVEWGVWNPQSLEFYPVGQMLPGESAVFRMSPNLREEYSSPGTGTGTGAAGASEFRLKAEWAAGTTGVVVRLDGFER